MTKHRLNTSEGAEALGISTDAVRMRARRGKLASEHENGRLYVWVDDDEIDTKRGRTYDADVVRTSPTWVHLNDQLSWFDQKSGVNQRMYKQTRTVEIVLAASIPVL